MGSWEDILDERVRAVLLVLSEVRNLGDLSKVSDNDLAELSRRLTEADHVCRQIKGRHRQRQPSAA